MHDLCVCVLVCVCVFAAATQYKADFQKELFDKATYLSTQRLSAAMLEM